MAGEDNPAWKDNRRFPDKTQESKWYLDQGAPFQIPTGFSLRGVSSWYYRRWMVFVVLGMAIAGLGIGVHRLPDFAPGVLDLEVLGWVLEKSRQNFCREKAGFGRAPGIIAVYWWLSDKLPQTM